MRRFFKKSRVGWLWMLRQRGKHILFTLLNTSVAPTLASTYLAILVLIRGEFIPATEKLNNIYLLSGILFLFILGSLFISYYHFKYLPSEEYAKVSFGGNPPRNMLILISFEVWKICYYFTTNGTIIKLHNIASKAELTPSIIDKERKAIEKNIDYLNLFNERQQRTLQNIHAMKMLASEQLNIPSRRLCDYIFDFSPQIYSHRIKKLLQNWREILQLKYAIIDNENSDHLDKRIQDLCRSIKRIHAGIERRVDRQEELIKNADLLSYIHDFSSELSSSSSLRNYADAVSKICKAFVQEDSQKGANALIETQLKLKFLYYKRLAYPGFDLNRASHNFCTKMVKGSGISVYKELEEAFKLIPKIDPKKNRYPLTIDHLKSLGKFYAEFENQVTKNRVDIAIEFKKILKGVIQKDDPARILIVTHNFSKNVRQIIKKKLLEVVGGSPKEFAIYLLSDNNSQDDLFKTRLFKYELSEDQEFNKTKKELSNFKIMAGDIDVLNRIVTENTMVVMLLGAECFDKKKRVIHTAGINKDLLTTKENIEQNLGKQKCYIYAVGEEFKLYDDLALEQSLRQDHLGGIDFYNPIAIEAIVYGNGKIIT